MKTKLHLLAILPALVFSSSCSFMDLFNGGKKMKNVNVIILSGQSNAVGCKASKNLINSMGQEAYDKYLEGFENIKIAYNNYMVTDYNVKPHPMALQNSSKGKFVKVQLGQGNVPENFGPEIGMAEELTEKWGDKLYIIKVASGGSNLNDDWAQYTDEMFNNLVNFVSKKLGELEEEGLKPYIRAFCWMQGEGDAYPNYHQYYKENLDSLKYNLDKSLLKFTEDDNLPFIDAGIGPGPHKDGTNEWVYYKEVNEEKQRFAAQSETNIYFDTIEAGLHSNQEPSDDVHYDSESQIKLGHLFAQNFEKFLK